MDSNVSSVGLYPQKKQLFSVKHGGPALLIDLVSEELSEGGPEGMEAATSDGKSLVFNRPGLKS